MKDVTKVFRVSRAVLAVGLVLVFMTGAEVFGGRRARPERKLTMEKVSYAGWPNCIKLSNGQVELIATTDVGPRIMRFGFVGGQNLLNEYKDQVGKTGGKEWRIYGGHRLWHAPEHIVRTYSLDNSPIKHSWDGKTLTLTQDIEAETGIVKEIEVTLDSKFNVARVLHRLTNKNMWEIEAGPHPEFLLPARPLVLWSYTDMSDPRWSWGTKYIQLKQDPKVSKKQKAGILNKVGWGAYYLNGELFVKHYPYVAGATYPDMGCNTETFTNDEMLEFETLGPLVKIPADGGKIEHVERWSLFKVKVGEDESDIDKKVLPLVK